jgi:hypothetical protein
MRGVTLDFSRAGKPGASSGSWQSRPPSRPMKPAVSGHPRSKLGGKFVEGGFSSPKRSKVGGKLKSIPASVSLDKTGSRHQLGFLPMRGRHAGVVRGPLAE